MKGEGEEESNLILHKVTEQEATNVHVLLYQSYNILSCDWWMQFMKITLLGSLDSYLSE